MHKKAKYSCVKIIAANKMFNDWFIEASKNDTFGNNSTLNAYSLIFTQTMNGDLLCFAGSYSKKRNSS